MPKFDYQCSNCNQTTERTVLVDARDEQYCECGNHLVRLCHYSTLAIDIPDGWGETMKSSFLPQNDEERATWDRDGVGSARWV